MFSVGSMVSLATVPVWFLLLRESSAYALDLGGYGLAFRGTSPFEHHQPFKREGRANRILTGPCPGPYY
jgi:hypothetical protein